MNKILVLCYPSHTTHILQGLGVGIFAILKRYLSEEQDKREHKMGGEDQQDELLSSLWQS